MSKEGTTSQNNEKNGFQRFAPKGELSKIIISEQLLNELPCGEQKGYRLVNKYLSIDYFIESILQRYFYMSAPSKWEDPFETKYLEILDGPVKDNLQLNAKDQLKEMSIYCTCMTYNGSDNEEASWRSYGDDIEQIIRVSYDFDKLCKILDKAIDENIYIGKMNYQPREKIVKDTIVFDDTEGEDDPLAVLYVNNFCLKQDAYQYEKELRFCKIKKGENIEEEYRIENVDLSPAIIQITLPPIKHKKLDAYKSISKNVDQIKKYVILKTICPDVPIHVSNLYDSSKVEMTSELKL